MCASHSEQQLESVEDLLPAIIFDREFAQWFPEHSEQAVLEGRVKLLLPAGDVEQILVGYFVGVQTAHQRYRFTVSAELNVPDDRGQRRKLAARDCGESSRINDQQGGVPTSVQPSPESSTDVIGGAHEPSQCVSEQSSLVGLGPVAERRGERDQGFAHGFVPFESL